MFVFILTCKVLKERKLAGFVFEWWRILEKRKMSSDMYIYIHIYQSVELMTYTVHIISTLVMYR